MATGREAALESKYSLDQPTDQLQEVELFTSASHQEEGKYSSESTRRSRADSYTLFHQALNEIDLLKQVMNANPTEVKKILDTARSVSDCLPLIKTHGTERCGRRWLAISPLQLAAWAGDNDMVRLLLSYIPSEFRYQAVQQLMSVYTRTDRDDHGNYLAPYRALLKAYERYDKRFPYLRDHGKLDEIDQMWVHEIGYAQRMLPMVGLQEFCDPKPFNPTPDFKQPPRREYQLSDDGFDVNLLGVKYALYHGGTGTGREALSKVSDRVSLKDPKIFVDWDAMRHLCTVRAWELRGIIEGLRKSLPKKEESEQEMEARGPCCSIS